MADVELPLPQPVERALDALEDGGWDTDWRQDGPTTIHLHARRGRWRLRTAFRRPPVGTRGGWKAGNIAINDDGPRMRRVNRRSLAAVAAATEAQLDRLLGGGEVAGVNTGSPQRADTASPDQPSRARHSVEDHDDQQLGHS